MRSEFTRLGTVLALALAMAVSSAVGAGHAGGRSARAFVASVYAPYVDAHSEGAGLDSPASYCAVFEPVLAALLIEEDEAEFKRHDPRERHDILVDADAWSIDRLKIAVVSTGSRTAAATVTFDNVGRPAALKLDLVRLTIGWRIADIHSASGDLRARFIE